ncbi:MAG: N-acetylmuramoyl-L-alanine amidase [Chloroflexota bacterium]|nr:N-acetylmuramoyl-L-alanine amidase [Chloroflexota bacterium]
MDEPGAIWIPTTQHFPGRNGHTAKWVIVHGTAGFSSAEDVAHYFQQAEASTHYIIGQDGRIIQCVRESQAAWGNGPVTRGHDPWWSPALNPNYVTISIEHLKPHRDNSDHLTEAQKHASFTLIRHICERHNIPKRKADTQGGITGHFSMDPINRSYCPGPYPWDELFASLQNGGTAMIDLTMPAVAAYFENAGNGTWRCKHNSLTLRGGILAFYRAIGGAGLNGLTLLGLPLTNELSPRPGVAIQRFERGVLAYDPQHTLDNPPGSGEVYLLHIDSGSGQDPRLTTTATQLATEQQQLVTLHNQVTSLQTQVAELQAVNADFHRQVTNLQIQLASLQRAPSQVSQTSQTDPQPKT